MVIFLKLLVSGNAILNVATHMSLIYLFFMAFPSKVGRFEWLESCDFLKFQNWLIFIFSYFSGYQILTTFITVFYWTLLAL